MLKVVNLNKNFGDNQILKNINISAEDGEIVCIRGLSGGGKTTFIRCIANIETPTSGQIIIDSIDMRSTTNNKLNADLYAQKVGLVFQDYNLFPHLNVIDNLILAPISQKIINKQDAIKKAMKLLQKLGIDSKSTNYPFQLSGGQKQRVAVARAAMLNPNVLCFDEPTSALDKDSTNDIATMIRDLAAQGMTVVVISHDYDFCDMLGDLQYEIKNSTLCKLN